VGNFRVNVVGRDLHLLRLRQQVADFFQKIPIGAAIKITAWVRFVPLIELGLHVLAYL
jgi:hypothetical protein